VPFGVEIPDKAFFKIGEVARLLAVKPFVLRYWETEFERLRPEKSRTGQRAYSRADVALLAEIKHLLYERRFTIAGARKRLHRAPAEERAEAVASRDVLRRVARDLQDLLRLVEG
jgi:DNA-binding transcriptional MerR regulator